MSLPTPEIDKDIFKDYSLEQIDGAIDTLDKVLKIAKDEKVKKS